MKSKVICEDLIKAYYNEYAPLKDKGSKHAATQTADLLKKLLYHTKRSFIYLNRASVFAEIAKQAYYIAFAHAKWKYAADLAYDIGRIYYESGKYSKEGTRTWVETLRRCLEKANSAHDFDRYWTTIYNQMKQDSLESLNKPTDIKAQKSFYDALTYAAKLYDLEGLSKQDRAK